MLSRRTIEENPSHEAFADQVGLQDWSGTGRGSHVDFAEHEKLPLTEGRLLGHGVNGGVHETVVNGISLAWKKIYCRKRIGPEERKEIEILKNLNHSHIVKLAGTYTHGRYLGMLLWPVAISDMATFFEDITQWPRPEVVNRLENLGLSKNVIYKSEDVLVTGKFRKRTLDLRVINRWFICLVEAIEFLHAERIRHKDLKPSNILLGHMGKIWLTDFGSSTDFSLLSTSETNNGDRGTPKYFAPEVAAFQPSGRAADIFSLGCVFIEMLSILGYVSLDKLKSCRSNLDGSYHANLPAVREWLDLFPTSMWIEDSREKIPIIQDMIDADPARRPKAVDISKAFLTLGIGVPCDHASAIGLELHTLQVQSLRAEISRLKAVQEGSDKSVARWQPYRSLHALDAAVEVSDERNMSGARVSSHRFGMELEDPINQ